MISLGLITRNSSTKLKRTPISFRQVLETALRVVPDIDTIIISDASSDETPRIARKVAEKHRIRLILIRADPRKDTRALARQRVIDRFLEETSDRWLLFLDDDVILEKNFYNEARQYFNDPRIGMIWGIARPVSLYFLYGLLRLLRQDPDTYLIEEFKKRGGTHDLFLRREAIEGIKIPAELHIFEDWYIKKYVEERGYRYAIVRSGCLHYNPGYLTARGALTGLDNIRLAADLACRYGIEKPSTSHFFKTFLAFPINLIGGCLAYGLPDGVLAGAGRWIEKLYYRYRLLKCKYPNNRISKNSNHETICRSL